MANGLRSRNYLLQARLERHAVPSFDAYPFNIPAISGMHAIDFERPVTFLVGENGSGKSTLLEAVAAAWGLNPEGGSRNMRFATRPSHSALRDCISLVRRPGKTPDSYFLRAESFYNVATEIEALDKDDGPRPRIIGSYGGVPLHEQSHGESFFALFMHRIEGAGFYVFDEPEAALSPMRQLSFLTRLHDLVGVGAQFLIATHSPILLAYPGAAILRMDDGPPRQVEYRETEHYQVTRNFLNRTEQMLAVLLEERDRSRDR